MKKKLLSICIPVYNRKNIFEICLRRACEVCTFFEEEVEIVVSDNASSEDLVSIVKDIRKQYPKIDIVFSRNDENIGLAGNFLKTVDLSTAEFCWIIGSDDFIKIEAVQEIKSIINNNSMLDFIVCNYDLIKIEDEDIDFIDKNFDKFYNKLNDNNYTMPHKAPDTCLQVNELDELISPVYNNVLLGAVMVGIFRRDLWSQSKISKDELRGFDSLKNIYPHCYIYASSFLHKKAYYCGKPLITVGEGLREWSTDNGNTYWNSSLPIIYFNIIGDMLDEYKKNGLSDKSYKKSLKMVSEMVGNLFYPVFCRKYITRKYIKDCTLLKPLDKFKKYGMIPKFYFGVLKGMIKYIFKIGF